MSSNDFHAFCKGQVMRFAGRLGWVDPKENSAPVKDLISALERGARGNSETAKRIADICIESPGDKDGKIRCPTVPDILRVAQELRDQEATGPKFGFTGCEACGFSGWISVEKNGYDYAAPCTCRPKPQASTARPPDGGRASNVAGVDSRMRQAGER